MNLTGQAIIEFDEKNLAKENRVKPSTSDSVEEDFLKRIDKALDDLKVITKEMVKNKLNKVSEIPSESQLLELIKAYQ